MIEYFSQKFDIQPISWDTRQKISSKSWKPVNPSPTGGRVAKLCHQLTKGHPGHQIWMRHGYKVWAKIEIQDKEDYNTCMVRMTSEEAKSYNISSPSAPLSWWRLGLNVFDISGENPNLEIGRAGGKEDVVRVPVHCCHCASYWTLDVLSHPPL